MFQQVFEFLIFTAGLGIIYEFSIMLLITTKSDTEVNLVNGGRLGAGLGWLAAVVLVADCPDTTMHVHTSWCPGSLQPTIEEPAPPGGGWVPFFPSITLPEAESRQQNQQYGDLHWFLIQI